MKRGGDGVYADRQDVFEAITEDPARFIVITIIFVIVVIAIIIMEG